MTPGTAKPTAAFPGGRRSRAGVGVGVVALTVWVSASAACAGDLTVTKAWVAPTDEVGSDAVLSLELTNAGAADDALVRATCPFANFSEKRTVDHGEGAPAKRVIPNIPVPAHSALTLIETGNRVALLQVREPLVEGAGYACTLSFRKAGAIEVPVKISRSEPSS